MIRHKSAAAAIVLTMFAAPTAFADTVCVAAGWKSSEEQPGGAAPKYVYVSGNLSGPGDFGAFMNFVRAQYGHLPDGVPVLDIYKSTCFSGDTASSVRQFVQSVYQDGGTLSVTEVDTNWTP